MNKETFHATIKMITGEEVLAQVMPNDSETGMFFVLQNPIVIDEKTTIDPEKKMAVSGLIPKKWMNFATDDMTVINMNHVVSISELDKFGIEFYNTALLAARLTSPIKRQIKTKDNIGYLGTIEEFRKGLLDTYNNSPDVPNNESQS